MHLIIDTEDYVNAAPAEGEGDRSEGEGGHSHSDEGDGGHPHSDEGQGGHPHSDEGEGSHAYPSPSCSGGRVAAASALELLQEELLSRFFPGVAPQLPSSSRGAGASSSGIIFQLQQSVVALMDEGNVIGSVERRPSDFQTPPTVIRVSPAAVCCQPPAPPLLSSPPDDADISGGGQITVWLLLSAPLPSERVTLLARHRGGFLDARLEQADGSDGALITKVRVL